MLNVLKTATTAAGAFAGLRWAPTVELRRDTVHLGRSAEHVIALLRERLLNADPGDILAAEQDRIVRRFAGSAGRFTYRTTELVTFESHGVTFEHLAGPFKTCHERFDLVNVGSGSTITHSGSFQLRGGIWTAPLALVPVKSAFEAHVLSHFEAMAAELSP